MVNDKNEIIEAINNARSGTITVPYDSLSALDAVTGGDGGENGKYDPPTQVENIFGWTPLSKNSNELNGYIVRNHVQPLPSIVLCKAGTRYTLYYEPSNNKNVICPDEKGISHMIICYPPVPKDTCQEFYNNGGCKDGTVPSDNGSTECGNGKDDDCQTYCCEDELTCQDFYDDPNGGCTDGTVPSDDGSTACGNGNDDDCQTYCCKEELTCQDFYEDPNGGCTDGTVPSDDGSTACGNGNDDDCQTYCCKEELTCQDFYEDPNDGTEENGGGDLACGTECQEECCEGMHSGVFPEGGGGDQPIGSSDETGSSDENSTGSSHDGSSEDSFNAQSAKTTDGISSTATIAISATVAALVGTIGIAAIVGYMYKRRNAAAADVDSVNIPEQQTRPPV
eukprot:Clim_evm2s35 gene=Clim_evmTU2s35